MPLTIPRILFDPDGKPLTVEVLFPTLQIVTYRLILKEAGSNSDVLIEVGDNTNPEDDKYMLPTPVKINDYRSLHLYAAFIDPAQKPNAPYEADAVVKQGATVRGKLVVSGTMTEKSADGHDWAKLIAQVGV